MKKEFIGNLSAKEPKNIHSSTIHFFKISSLMFEAVFIKMVLMMHVCYEYKICPF